MMALLYLRSLIVTKKISGFQVHFTNRLLISYK